MGHRIDIDKAADGAGDGAEGAGEDDGHDAAHIQLQGQVAVLPADLLAAHHTPRILDGDAALGVGHDDDEHHDGQCQDHQQRQQHVVQRLPAGCAGEHVGDHGGDRRPVGDDGREDDEGDAVADALVIDLLAAPGGQLRARGKGQDHHDGGKDACRAGGVLQGAHVAHQEVVADAQHQGDAGAHVAGDLPDLVLAVGFLGQVLEIRDGNRQQLHDNRGIDIGCDA